MSNLRENLNTFNYHFDSAYKKAEHLREQVLELEKAKAAAEKKTVALLSLLSIFPQETQTELLQYVDTISRGLPLFGSLAVMKTFAEGVQKSNEYADFLEWAKQQIDTSEAGSMIDKEL